MLTLKIKTDNAAFADDAIYHECARLLRKAADKLEADHTDAVGLYDLNGNLVGHCHLTLGRGRRRA